MLAHGYDELKPDAATSGLIRIDSVNGRVYDGSNLSASPCQQRSVFAVALSRQLPTSGTGTVYVGQEFWLGTGPVPATLTIDFGDGLGPRLVAMNSTVQVTLGGGGNALASGPTTTLTVTNPATGLRGAASYSSAQAIAPPDAVIGVRATTRWGSLPAATALAWVKWGAGNNSGRFRRPLIFVEGIDFEGSFYQAYQKDIGVGPAACFGPPAQTQDVSQAVLVCAAINDSKYRNGSNGWNEMVAYNPALPEVEKLPTLRQQLIAQGYDIIYLDFDDGATHIQSNAMALVELLDWINRPANRAPDAQENLVAAASMGGTPSPRWRVAASTR